MNAKEMLARYAQGGMVDESVDVSKARQMLQNLTSPVQHFASGSEVVPAGFRRSLFTGELVPIAATVEQLTDIYRGGEAQQANADAAARAIAAAETPVQASPAVSAAPATETRLSLFTNEPVPVNASVQDLIDINSDYSFPSEPAASTVTASPSTVAQDIATLSSGEKQPSTAASDLLDLNKVASPAPGPSTAAVTSATIGEPPTSQGPDAVALASELGIPTFQVVSLLNQGLDASAIRNRYDIPVSVATDLMQRSMTGGVDTYEFDKLGGYDRVKKVYDAAGGSYTPPFGQKPVVPPPVPPVVSTPVPPIVSTPEPSVILPPTQPLPPLTEEFVAPTAPPPEAPPVALTPGQEGLDPSTAIVGATPIENRVARVTETAINKIPESERVKIPQLDTEFRASAPRTAIYDRFGRITGYNYSPAAKLTPATGTNVFNFVPPGITSRPRSLLNIGDVPGVTIDPVTGQPTLGLSASQRFARDRAELDNQFRRLYARAAETDTSLPTQAPSTAAAAFRNFAMNDPTMSAQLRMRNIEQTPTVSPTASMVAARSEYGAAPYAAALAEAFDPFLARNRASLLASKDMQRSYFERYPDLVAEYEKNWSKTMSPEEYAAYHYRTLGQKEGRTPPNLMGSPYTQQFFSKGGEASTEDFIKKQSGGDVSRETASPTNPLDYTPGLSDKGLGAGFADPGVVEMIDRFDRNQLRSTPELTALDQLIALQGSNVLNQGLANTMSVDQITGDIDPVQSLRNLQAYDPASFEATLRTLQDVPSLVPQSGLGSLRLGMEQLQGLEGVTPTQVGETANAFATMLKQPETGSQVQDIAQNIRSIIENQPLARFQTNVGFTPEGNVDPYAVFRRTGGISYKEPSALEDPLVPPIPPGFQEGGEVNVSRGTSEVPQLDAEGRLIDEREEIRSESQRMLNRLQSQPSKLPPGLRRTVAATKEQGKESMIPAAAPARDLLSGILGASPTAPGSEAYRTGQAIANMPPVQAAAAIPAKIAASAGDAATALAAMGPAVGAVMKPKGGNWLAPSVERGLSYLIPRTGAGNRTAKETLEEMNRTYPAEELARMPETRAFVDRAYQWLEPNVAIQNWIEKKLTKYVKNEMATPEDPVRALAERGILHVDPEQLNSYPGAGNPRNQAVQRRSLGYPEEGLAKSEAAKRWETASDYMIQTDRAQDLLDPRNYGQGFVDQTLAANPWLAKVDPYERIYGVDTLNYRPDYSELGFDHLIDELKNSLNPNSGLPRSLQLTPKQLDKVSMPQAVELVDKINKWRAEQKAVADLKRSQNAATVEYKAYDTIPGTTEPNQRGLRWVELKPATMSEDFVAPDRYSIVRPTPSSKTFAIQDSETGKYITTGLKSEEQARKHLFDTLNRQQLEDALKYEGEVMGHCVGGYCPDVEEGRSRIYSLRDAKGEPHVTIEVKPNPYAPRWEFVKGYLPQAEEMMRARGITNADEVEIAELATQIAKENMPPLIQQIKGKANRAPKDEYLPFVQDFVRSGNWSNVQDLENAGLTKLGNKYLTPEEVKPLVEQSIRYLEQSPALEYYRNVHREYDAHRRDPFSTRNRVLEAQAGLQVHPDIPYTYREMMSIFQDPGAYGPGSLSENIERVNRLRQLYGEEGFARGGPVNVPRETSTSKQQLDKLAQVSQRKKA